MIVRLQDNIDGLRAPPLTQDKAQSTEKGLQDYSSVLGSMNCPAKATAKMNLWPS